MTGVFRAVPTAFFAAALAGLATQASAQTRGDRYEMVNVQQYQNTSFGGARAYDYSQGTRLRHRGHYPANNVIILDKRSGELWSWSDAAGTVMYLGQIFPLAGAGSIARIITIDDKAR